MQDPIGRGDKYAKVWYSHPLLGKYVCTTWRMCIGSWDIAIMHACGFLFFRSLTIEHAVRLRDHFTSLDNKNNEMQIGVWGVQPWNVRGGAARGKGGLGSQIDYPLIERNVRGRRALLWVSGVCSTIMLPFLGSWKGQSCGGGALGITSVRNTILLNQHTQVGCINRELCFTILNGKRVCNSRHIFSY